MTREGSMTSGDHERRRITGRAAVVGMGTLLSRALGLGRDLVLAAVFSRAMTDAFFVAFTIPNVLRQLFAEGALQTAVLPVLSKTQEEAGEARARELYRRLLGLSLFVLILVTLAGVAAAPLLVDLFAFGFREHPGQYERTVTLTRWVFPYILFMGVAALGVAALNTHQRFVASSFAPALLNVAFIGCALSLPAFLQAHGHDPILAMAMGALLGGLLQVVAQWPSLHLIGYLRWPRLVLADEGVRLVLKRMAPTLLGIGVYYIDVILARRFLSELPIGAQSYFSWALRLCDFPQGIFVMALQTATLPSLALLVARKELAEVSKTFAYSMRLSLFVGLPATALLFTLSEPLVVLLFQRGEFDALAARETARALSAQALGVWTVAAVRQLVAVYYALGDTRTPVLVAAIDLVVFITLALGLRSQLGHVGISLAVAGASFSQMVLLWLLLRRRLSALHSMEIARSAARTALASLAAGACAWASVTWLSAALPDSLLSRWLLGLGGISVFCFTFLAAATATRSTELSALLRPLVRRFRGGREA